MDKRDLAANADENLAQQYPTPTADGQSGDTPFYHATGADVGLDQIDPQLEGMQTGEARGGAGDGAQLDDSVATTEANVQALVAAVSGADDVDVSALGGNADESYPESHLRALKTEDASQHDGGAGNVGAYVDASQAGHTNDENNMYAAAALEHVQQAAAAQQAESQNAAVGHHEQQQQQPQSHDQGHNEGHDQNQQGRPPVSVEELQLAAQLSQGLAPMMREANARREGEFHDVNNNVNTGVGVGGNADAGTGLHDGQNDADALRVAAAAAAAAADNAYGSPDVASAYHHTLQHPADVQGHAGYADASQAVGHLPPSLQMAQMAQQYNVDHIPPRKRSKVSRACDACRRKKIKCDSVTETEQCTNCRRARTECLFSRVPQKRGPSKGYIKELADRINSIEGKLGNQSPSSAADALELLGRGADAGDASNNYARYSLNENAKRSFASMSAGTPDGSPAPSNRQTTWATPTQRPSGLFQTPAGSAAPTSRTPYSAVSLAPQPQIDTETPNALVRSLTDMERLLPLADHESQELDDVLFGSYLAAVHPCLPFLPGDRSRVLQNLAQCPQFLQDAFVVALRAVSDALGSAPTAGLARVSTALLAQWETEGTERTSLHDLVHLQTLLLLAVEADTHGPAALKGHHGGLSKTALLSRAVAVSYEMDLPKEQLGSTAAAISAAAAEDPSQSEGVDTDSEARLGLRAWWSLVVLDRWNAIALGKNLLIPLRSVVLSPGLRQLLGESAFQFTKLSYLLGSSIAPSLVSADPSRQLSSPTAAAFLGPLAQQLDLGLEMWRADLPDSVTESAAPLVHLGYWQYRLLSYLLQPSTLSSDVSWATKKVVELTLVATDAKAVFSRRGPAPPITPFHHYFICLSGLILAELSKVANERQAALRTLNDLLEVVAPKPIPVEDGAEGATEIPNSSVWNGPLRETLARRLKSGSVNNNDSNAASAANAAAVAAAAVAAAAAAAVEATMSAKEGNGNGVAAEPTKPAPLVSDDSLLRGPSNYENLGFNPLTLLRSGFLNTVHKTPVTVPAVAAPAPEPTPMETTTVAAPDPTPAAADEPMMEDIHEQVDTVQT